MSIKRYGVEGGTGTGGPEKAGMKLSLIRRSSSSASSSLYI